MHYKVLHMYKIFPIRRHYIGNSLHVLSVFHLHIKACNSFFNLSKTYLSLSLIEMYNDLLHLTFILKVSYLFWRQSFPFPLGATFFTLINGQFFLRWLGAYKWKRPHTCSALWRRPLGATDFLWVQGQNAGEVKDTCRLAWQHTFTKDFTLLVLFSFQQTGYCRSIDFRNWWYTQHLRAIPL